MASAYDSGKGGYGKGGYGKGKGKGYDSGKGGYGQGANYGTRGFGARAKRTVDFNSSCVSFLDHCMEDEVQPAPLPAHYSYVKDMKPAFMSQGAYAYDSTCCHQVFTCVPRASRAALTAACWQPDGKRYITGSNTGELTLWNGTQFTQDANFQGHHTSVRAMKWFPQQQIMMSGDGQGQVKVWDSQYVNFHTMQTHKESIRDLAVAPNSLKFVTCADESHAKVWDLRTGREERAFTGHGWDVKSISWHPQKGLVATGSKDSQIKLWDPRVGEAICTLFAHSNMVTKVRFSSGEGSWLVSGARDHLVKVFDLKTMSIRKTFKNHNKEITAMDFHPDIETLFCSASHDGAMYWWDVNYDSALAGFGNAHIGTIWSLAYHPMGHLMASSAHDGSSKMWARVRPGDDRPAFLVQGAMEDPALAQPIPRHGGATVAPIAQSTGAQPHARVLLTGVFDKKMNKNEGVKLPYLPGAIPGVGADAPEPIDGDATPGSSDHGAPDLSLPQGQVGGVLDASMFEVQQTPKNIESVQAVPVGRQISSGSGFDLDFAAAVQQSSGGAARPNEVDDDATPAADDDATPANFGN